jgi:tetratricopeptide (TPR) repeat protein
VIDRIGLSLFGMKRYDEAIPFLRRSVEMDPDRASGHRLLAEALLRGGAEKPSAEDYGHALDAARAYRQRSPGDPAADNLVGRAALGAALDCDPRSAEALELLAMVYRLRQRLREALRTYELLYALQPSSEVEASIGEVRYNPGGAGHQPGRRPTRQRDRLAQPEGRPGVPGHAEPYPALSDRGQRRLTPRRRLLTGGVSR